MKFFKGVIAASFMTVVIILTILAYTMTAHTSAGAWLLFMAFIVMCLGIWVAGLTDFS